MFTDVYHIGYRTYDKDAAIAFYRKLGGDVKMESAGPDGGTLVFMRIGGTEVEIIQPEKTASLRDGPLLVLDHIGYAVDDIAKSLSELESKGMKRLWPEIRTNAEGARIIYMDPATTDGVRFHLTQRPPS